MKRHIMLDLETMGKKPGCAIVSIGACAFDKQRLFGTFYININLADCVKNGLHLDADTVMWWLKQSDQARTALTTNQNSLTHALEEFSLWHAAQTKNGEALVWGNGASFDQPILEAAYHAIGRCPPWKYWETMCYRTIKNLNKDCKEALPANNDQHHNAAADALWQAQHLMNLANLGRVEL